MARLRRSDCSGPGIRRRGRGRGFEYVAEDGTRVTDSETRARLDSLAIPPAWKDVWICSDPLGHLQATGIDGAGRKQYLYHPRWRERRDQEKFERMVALARKLPRLRRGVEADLAGEEMGRERVLACIVRLLDRSPFRIGGEDYADQNETYGLATLRRAHVRLDRERVLFDYEAKGGQRQTHAIADPDVRPVIEALKRRRSRDPALFAHRDGAGRWRELRSEDINAYIKELIGEDFSAKDFRTWHATALAALSLASQGSVPATKTARTRAIGEAVKEVATVLGNTPTVCRTAYIDPRVLDRYRDGEVIDRVPRAGVSAWERQGPKLRRRLERAVIGLIDG